MTEKETLVLGDPEIRPDDDYLFSILGEKREIWKSIMKHLNENYKDTSGEWRYYKDGWQWLFKMQQKKKTIFWIGVLKDTFKITFYFGDKAEPVIERSDLSEELKLDFKTGRRYGAIRAISIRISGDPDLENIFRLIAIKTSLK